MNVHPHSGNNAISLKDKRLNLIRAAQDLGIDKESLCAFLRTSIEAEQQCLKLISPIVSAKELNDRARAIMEADLLRLTLEHF